MASVGVAARDVAVGVDATVTEERPVRACGLDRTEVARNDQDLLAIGAGAREDLPRRIDDEALTPELDALAARIRLVADAVRRRDEDAVRDRVAPLHRLPRFVLRLAVLLLL